MLKPEIFIVHIRRAQKQIAACAEQLKSSNKSIHQRLYRIMKGILITAMTWRSQQKWQNAAPTADRSNPGISTALLPCRSKAQELLLRPRSSDMYFGNLNSYAVFLSIFCPILFSRTDNSEFSAPSAFSFFTGPCSFIILFLSVISWD